MMTGKRHTPPGRPWLANLAISIAFVCVVMLIAGCKTTEQASSQRLELVRGVELRQDSTHHRWQVHRVTLYDAGQVAKVEEVEQHAQEVITIYERDTLYINKVDTLYITKSYPATTTTKTAGRWLGITLAISILVGGVAIYFWLKKKLPF